jgi:hypothetical protein
MEKRRRYVPTHDGGDGKIFERRDIGVLWRRYVGSRNLSEDEELEILNVLRGTLGRKVKWELHALYLSSRYWRRIRQIVLERDNFACVKCKSIYELHVDHKKYQEIFGEEVIGDLQTLCRICHAKKTKKFDLCAWSSKAIFVNFNGDSQLFSALRWSEEGDNGDVKAGN